MEDDGDDLARQYTQTLSTWMQDSLGVHESFLANLPNDDDWTFILKIHAMVEAGLNQMILNHFGEPRISRLITKLPIGNTGTGKLSFAKALDLIPLENREFVAVLSDIRNHCIHDIRNFRFDIKSYVQSLPAGKADEFMRAVTFRMTPFVEIPGFSAIPVEGVIKQNPRFGLFCAGMAFMGDVIIHEKKCQIRDVEMKTQRHHAEEFQRHRKSTPKE